MIKGRTAVPYAPVTIKTDAGRGVLTVLAERQNEIPRGHPGTGLDSRLPVRRDGRAGARLRRPGLRNESSKTARLSGRSAGDGRRPGRARVLLRPLPARPRRASSAWRSTPKAIPCRRACGRRRPPPATACKTTLDLRPAARGRKGAAPGDRKGPRGRQTGQRRGVRGDRPAQRAKCSRSAPTRSFDPNKFAKPLTEREYDELEGVTGAGGSEEVPCPLVDRATNGAYPTGSTFKPITAMAALEAGVINPSEGLGAGQCIDVGDRAVLQRRPRRLRRGGTGRSAEGLLGHLLLHGRRAGQQPRQRDPEQGPRARDRPGTTGIDLPSEIDRHRSQPANGWRRQNKRKKPSASARTTATRATSWPNRASRGASATTWTWRSARATCRPIPLQMAVAYSTLANAYMHGGYGDGRTSPPGAGDRRILDRRPGAER